MNVRLFYSATLLPYISVSIGLYVLNNAWAAMAGYLLGMTIFLALLRPPLRRADRTLDGPTKWQLAGMIAACLLSGPAVCLLWPRLARFPAGELAAALAGWGLSAQAWPLFAACMVLATPVLEEIYWRAWLGRAGRPEMEAPFWFAGYHLLVLFPLLRPEWLVAPFAALVLAGWWWGRLLRYRRGLAWAVLCHLAADASVLLATGWLMGW